MPGLLGPESSFPNPSNLTMQDLRMLQNMANRGAYSRRQTERRPSFTSKLTALSRLDLPRLKRGGAFTPSGITYSGAASNLNFLKAQELVKDVRRQGIGLSKKEKKKQKKKKAKVQTAQNEIGPFGGSFLFRTDVYDHTQDENVAVVYQKNIFDLPYFFFGKCVFF